MFNPRPYTYPVSWRSLIKQSARTMGYGVGNIRGNVGIFVAKNKNSNAISFNLNVNGTLDCAIYNCTINDIYNGAIDSEYINIPCDQNHITKTIKKYCLC